MATGGHSAARRFPGWPSDVLDLLLRLEGDPPVSVRNELRRDREMLMRQPMIALLQDVADVDPAYDDFSVWGFGKTVWWWQHQSCAVRIERGIELGVRLDLDGLAVIGHGWLVDPGQVQLYRAAAAADETGALLEQILTDLTEGGSSVGGQQLRRGPRGYPSDHPRAHLLRHRSIAVTSLLDAEPWLHGNDAVDRVLAGFGRLRPVDGVAQRQRRVRRDCIGLRASSREARSLRTRGSRSGHSAARSVPPGGRPSPAGG